MIFRIQTSNPRLIKEIERSEESIEDIIEDIFPLNTENAYLVWNYVHIPISYKYDISLMFKDIMVMLETIINHNEGKYYIFWPSNTFSSEWELSWDNSNISIKSKWHSVVGGTEDILNLKNNLNLGKLEFLSEWKPLLTIIKKALTESGYQLKEVNEISNLELLEKRINNNGELYQ